MDAAVMEVKRKEEKKKEQDDGKEKRKRKRGHEVNEWQSKKEKRSLRRPSREKDRNEKNG